MTLTNDVLCELDWWIENIASSFNPVSRGDPTFIITTDSSEYGWGAVVTDSDLYTGGLWSSVEQKSHINFLELKAALLSLQSFCATITDVHVRLYMDNMVAISYISNMGGKCDSLNVLAREIWFWCVDRNIWISASHIPGADNVEADRLSRKMNADLEWQIRPDIFSSISSKYKDSLSIDLFASRINYQLPMYVSYLPDPHAFAVDAFSIKWSNEHGFLYLFPPFSVIDRVLQKLVEDQATAVLVAPLWTTQPWFPGILARIAGDCYLLLHVNNSLIHPACPTWRHPLQKNEAGCILLIRDRLLSDGISAQVASVVIDSWKDSTKKQYGCYFKKWMRFCIQRQSDPLKPNAIQLLEFLNTLYQSGLGYSALNTAKSAICSFASVNTSAHDIGIGNHSLIKRFLKGVFSNRPALPRYSTTWDVSVVLRYLKRLGNDLPLLQLSCKVVTLLALVTGQRGQSLHSLHLSDLHFMAERLDISFSSSLKTTRPGYHQSDIKIKRFTETDLCVVHQLEQYIQKTKDIRQSNNDAVNLLFIGTVMPHKPVSRDTISRWIKMTLSDAGIDMTKFSEHSTRGAACRAAAQAGIPIQTILKTAGWRSDCTFRKFYDKPVESNVSLADIVDL